MSLPPSKQTAAVTVIDITDPTSADDETMLIDLKAVQLGSAPFHARRIIVRAEAACLLFHSTTHRVKTRTKTCDELVAYTLFHPSAEGIINGIPVRPGLMLAIEPATEVDAVVRSNWETTTFLLPPDLVRGHLAARQRAHEFSMPCGIEMLQVSANAAQQLFEWGKHLAETAAQEAATLNQHQDSLWSVQHDLIEKLLATLGTAQNFKPTGNDRTRQRHSHIAKVAEDYALAQHGTNLYVSDLCRVTGVSERTLEYAFMDVMQMTPITFLSRLRLHRVRHELLAARPGSTTIAQEALRWGFWHFGEFSRSYQNCFGELPSDTLRRKEQAA